MPIGAVSLSGVHRSKGVTAQAVLTFCNELKVRQIHARARTAQMINLKALRNWTEGVLVVDPVCISLHPVDLHPRVSISTQIAEPQPATGVGLRHREVVDPLVDRHLTNGVPLKLGHAPTPAASACQPSIDANSASTSARNARAFASYSGRSISAALNVTTLSRCRTGKSGLNDT